MAAFWARLTLGILALLTGLVSASRFLPHAENPLEPLFAPPPGCALPCWQGIRPNETSDQAALDLLDRNPLIVQVDFRQQIYATSPRLIWYIYWTWQDESGEKIHGSLTVQNRTVRVIRIYKQIPFGALWGLLGEPERGSFVGTLTYQDRQPTSLPLYHTASYPGSGLTVQTDASCARFWWQPSTLTFRGEIDAGDDYNLQTYRSYTCKGWAM